MATPDQDIRWQQRLHNFSKALQTLQNGVELAQKRELTELEQQGMIKGFEFTHELAWNVLKDYLENKGISGLIGSKDATRIAFKNGLIEDGEAWMEMIKARNQTVHLYDPALAKKVINQIQELFYPAFMKLKLKFTNLLEAEN